MAQTELTAEQQAMWQNAVATVGNYGGAFVSVAAKPLEQAVDLTGNALHTLNHGTPSLAGRPMTEILGIDNPKEIVTNAVDNFVAGITGAVVKETIGETPEAMVAKFAADPALQTEDGQKLIQIMKDDPEFTQAFHTAMINDPTMAPGIAGLMNADGQEGGTSFKSVVDGLADPGTRSKFTQVLTAVGANDDLDFDYTMDVAEAANAVSQPGVKQEDYKKLQQLLLRANVRDPMLDFAVDPMAALQEAMKDPSAFADMLANSLVTMEGPMGDMMRGFIQGMGQYIELLVSPEMKEFYGEYIEPVVNDAIEKFGLNEDGVAAGAEAGAQAAADATVERTPTGPTTPEQQQSIMWQNPRAASEININPDNHDLDTLQGAQNNLSVNFRVSDIFTPLGTNAPQAKPPAPAPYAEQPFDLSRARATYDAPAF